MTEKVYRVVCDRCGFMVFARCSTLELVRDSLRVMNWGRNESKNIDICPACHARIGNVQVIPEGERHAHRH